MFREINEAMNVLGDKEMRDKYDSGLDLDQIKSGAGSQPDFGGMEDIFSMFMGGGMGGMGGSRGGARSSRMGGRGGFPDMSGFGGQGHS